MKLAVNYSPQAAALLTSGQIEVDLFKCPDWPDLIAEARSHRPVYIHFPINAGDGSVAQADWQSIEALRTDTDTPYVNMHLVVRREDLPEIPVDSRDATHLDAVASLLIRDVQAAVDRVGPERVIVENVIYRGPTGSMLYGAVAPEVITRVVTETGCGLLLDTAHAWVTAHHLGIDVQEYILKLPVQHLRELHVTGTQHDGQRWRDHMEMRAEDWALLGWVMERVHAGDWPAPWAVSLEYGGIGPAFEWRSKVEALAEQVPRLRTVLRQGWNHSAVTAGT